MDRVLIEHDFNAPVDRVFAYFAEHEHGNVIFAPIRVERLNDGTDGTRNGAGSRRKLSVRGVLPFEETITEVVPNQRIVYTVTKGTPLNHHLGTIEFSAPSDGRTHLRYTIELGAPVPGLAKAVAAGLDRGVRRNLPRVERELAAVG
jgi:uncharacterized protein YndB with AHSA1/START domain